MRKKYGLWLALLLLQPGAAWGGILDYRPRLVSSHATLSADLSYRSELQEESSAQGLVASAKSSHEAVEKKIRESLNLTTLSYLYHPDLFYFTLAGSGILDQITTETNGNPVESKVTSESYDFRGFLLRKKDYRGEIYLNSNKPFLVARGQGGQTEIENAGVELRYDKSPYRSLLAVNHSQNQSGADVRSVDHAKTMVGYTNEDFILDGVGERASDSAAGVQHLIDTLELNNRAVYKEVALVTEVTVQRTEYDVQSGLEYEVRETMSGKLPWNSRWRGHYSRQDNTTETVTLGSSRGDHRMLENLELELENKLFESLRTAVREGHRSNRSTSGGSVSDTLIAETHYQKKIWGGSVHGDLSNNILRLGNQGRITEKQAFAGAGISDKRVGIPDPPLVIPRGDIDPLSVVVEVETKNGIFISLSPNMHWYLKTDGPLPTIYIRDTIEEYFRLQLYEPRTAYNFRVTYTTLPADYTVQTNDSLLHMGVGFFENVWRTDYSHQYTVQDIISGDPNRPLAPAIASDSLSLSFVKAPFILSSGYRWVQADYVGKRWSSLGEFQKDINVLGPVVSKVRASAKKIESWLELTTGEAIQEEETSWGGVLVTTLPIPWTGINLLHEVTYKSIRGFVNEFRGYYNYNYLAIPTNDKDQFTTNLSCQTNIPKTRVTVTARGYYDKENFLGGLLSIRTGYKLAAGYNWNFGATNLSLHADYITERVETETGELFDTRSDTIADVYLRMTRQLF